MIEDTSPLGKSVEEIEREGGNLDSSRTPDGDQDALGGVIIPPTGLGGASGTATGAGLGVPVIPTVERGGEADGDGNT